jgi:hypothetical protein
MDTLAAALLTSSHEHEQSQEAPMISPGQTLENPVTSERFTFTHTAAGTGGELLAMRFRVGLRTANGAWSLA